VRIKIDLDVLGQTKWHEYAMRFFFGGLITAVAGIIAKKFGPEIGGLFLAFPAIFPASATLIEKHEKQKKERLGLNGTKRAAEATSLDAAGAAIGTIGLAFFALVVWKAIPNHASWLVLLGAALLWMGSSFLLWQIRERFAVYRRRNKRARKAPVRATVPPDQMAS
jgi:hypothetical protein